MSLVIKIGLLLLGLAAGFYVVAKVREAVANPSNAPGGLLWRQARRQARSWIAGLQRTITKDSDDSEPS